MLAISACTVAIAGAGGYFLGKRTRPREAADSTSAGPSSEPSSSNSYSASASGAASISSESSAVATKLRVATAEEVSTAMRAEEEESEDSEHVPPDIELKMVACVRTDLMMGKGKIAAQCGHAYLGSYRVALSLPLAKDWVKAWLFRGQAKICLKVEGDDILDDIARCAQALGVPCFIIADEGRTEVAPGTRTVIALGPAPVDVINKITGPSGQFKLKLLS